MHDQDKKFMQEWEKSREKGRWYYGLTHGTLFGFVIFILVNLFKLKDMSIVDVFFTEKAMIQLLTMVLAGFLGYSTVKWWMNQNIYNKIIYKDKNPSEMH